MQTMNILVIIGLTNYRQKWFKKHFVITTLGQRWRCRGRRRWRNVGPTRWRVDVKPAAKPNVAPTSPAYVAPSRRPC